MDKKCIGCGQRFHTKNLNRKRCKRACSNVSKNTTRTDLRETHAVEFVGVDGEGVTREDGTHDYVMLSVGDQTLTNRGERLEWWQIFEFVYDCFLENPKASYVGYFLGYDFTHWIKTMPEERARMLLTAQGQAKRARVLSGGNRIPFPVQMFNGNDDWEFDYLEGRRFKLRRNQGEWLYICDAGPFFQQSFVSAIGLPDLPEDHPFFVVSPEEYATICEGKSNRASAQLDADMVKYNVTENLVLSRLMARLNRGFTRAGVRLPRHKWFGPGQAAQAWLNNINAPTSADHAAHVPDDFSDAAQASYYGGWFEVMQHGNIPGVVHEYDINSAYPHIISTLPDLHHGEYKRGRSKPPQDSDYVLCYVKANSPIVGEPTIEFPGGFWDGGRDTQAHIGVLPWRNEAGGVARPTHVEGWYWQHEINAAKRAGLVGDITCHKWIAYYPNKAWPAPFKEIAGLYAHRQNLAPNEGGKNGPSGVALKLLYNSVYGKTAQSIGQPKYASSVYASLITAGCRVMIVDAIASYPGDIRDVVMVATDGIYFREPHPGLDIDPTRLGAWDHTEKHGLTTFYPGLYWDNAARERIHKGDNPKFKSRGISARDLAPYLDRIDKAFAELGGEWWHDSQWPNLTIPIAFSMTSAKQALAWNKWEKAGEVTTNGVRELCSEPSHHKRDDYRRLPSWKGARLSCAYSSYLEAESYPYRHTFGRDSDNRWEEGQTPDGTDVGDFNRLLFGR